jgi:hypothetical protein
MDVTQLLDFRDISTAALVGGAGYILRWASRVNTELGVLHERANGHERRLDGVERKVYNDD